MWFRILLILLLTTSAFADVAIKDQNSSTGWEINSNNAGEVVKGRSIRPTYIASVGAQATTAAVTLSIEASAGTGYRLLGFCVASSNATAAAAITVTVQRRTTASSSGTALTNEGTGTTAVSKMDPADSDFGGIARLGGTPGTAGAVIDQYGFITGELGAGAADPPGPGIFCINYDNDSGKVPVVAAGTTNGLSINVSSAGAGGLAAGSISARIVQE